MYINLSIADLLQIARAAALEAGATILQIYTSGDFETALKSDNSPLTKADRAAHEIISSHLTSTGLPILSEEGKELPVEERQQWEWYWLVDPLDGTKEFLKRNGEFTVNIALMHHHKPVAGLIYAPVLGSLYFGSAATGVYKETKEAKAQFVPLPKRSTLEDLLQKPNLAIVASRTHQSPQTAEFIQRFPGASTLSMGSSLKFMLLAEGKADLYPRFAPTMEWDTAAAHAMLNALNRSIYQADLQEELKYSKEDLHNPNFVAF